MNFHRLLPYLGAAILSLPASAPAFSAKSGLTLNDREYFETPGLNVLVFSNWYDGYFDDSKMSGVELIHHGERTVTNGDVRLNITPEQWDPIPAFIEREVDRDAQAIEAFLHYPDRDFNFSIKVKARNGGVRLTVNLDKPLPTALEGKAGFNLEFLPSAYFEKAFLMDERPGAFPLYPSGPKELTNRVDPEPLARGRRLVLAPEDPERRIRVESLGQPLALYDGRAKAQNGWFVLRSEIPAGKTGAVVEWQLEASTLKDWVRPPMIAHSQLGYHPEQPKVAVIELDKNDRKTRRAKLLQVQPDGERKEVLASKPKQWGDYLRYRYLRFDFSRVRTPGVYMIEYGRQQAGPFRIADDVYKQAWHPTLDVFFPVQMDHMLVNEAYRVWHGASHLDDALQAPVDHEHFDLYRQGPTTDTGFEPGEHIPGLNIGGWYDAGDYDIRTQTQYATVNELVHVWELFGLKRDNTTVDYDRRFVDIHVADGKPDLLQQIEHGTLALIAQHRALGRAIPGIVAAHLDQYTHLGDGITKTDNMIYDPSMDELESDGRRSGKFDDRWAFTSKTTPLNYGSAAALAAASRALKGYNDELAEECLAIATKVWSDEQAKPEPDLFSHGNTTGGPLETEMLKAAVELLITTGDERYARAVEQLLPQVQEQFDMHAVWLVRAMPHMPAEFGEQIKALARDLLQQHAEFESQNPFGVPITTGGWAGGGAVIRFAITAWYLHRAFPDLVGPEPVFRGLNYLYGTHPDHNLSLVSNVGTRSKKVAYGMNRADFSFISGGVVPGILILKPDYPENKEDWPFLWGENEYVINMGAIYIFLVNAVQDLLPDD